MEVYPEAPEVKVFIDFIKDKYDIDVDKINISKHVNDDGIDEWRMFVHTGQLVWVPWVICDTPLVISEKSFTPKSLINSRYSLAQTQTKKKK